jgi:hypothetical protein
MSVFFFMGFTAALACAQAGIRVPVLTFVLDDAQRVRPVIGVPGAASVGAPLDLGFQARDVKSSGRDFILATDDSGRPRLVQLRGGAITLRNADEFSEASTAGVERTALSSSGFAAALYSESARRVYAFTDLSVAPVLAGSFDVGDVGSITALAISDDARTVLVGLSAGDKAAAVFLLQVGRRARFLATVGRASAIAFFKGSDRAVIADETENRIFAFTEGALVEVATAADGISAPIGVAVSRDNQRIFVANSRPGSITIIGLEGIRQQSLPCDCFLSGLHATSSDSVFRLTDFSGRPVLILDASGASPRIVFAPLSSQF